MSTEPKERTEDFVAAFRRFIETSMGAPLHEIPGFPELLAEHLGAPPDQQLLVRHKFKPHDHPNLQVALDECFAVPGRSVRGMGLVPGSDQYEAPSLGDLLKAYAERTGGATGPRPGPMQYRHVDVGGGRSIACVRSGLFLLTEPEARHALVVSGSLDSPWDEIAVDVLSSTPASAQALLRELQDAVVAHNVYRGCVVRVHLDHDGQLHFEVIELPSVAREQIVLPEETLEQIERQAIAFSRHADTLRRWGHHLRRGILLYGPPGNGKTLTAAYLLRQMPERTALFLTGRNMDCLSEVCAIARTLQPATVVIEDVDLIAEARDYDPNTCAPLQIDLLNEMDGLASAHDVLFLMTTNRPDVLESALAERPGRVDFAVEIDVPDADCRARLFHLYGRGAAEGLEHLAEYVERTEGVSAAFIRELMRRSALLAADDGAAQPGDAHVDTALDELLLQADQIREAVESARALYGRSDDLFEDEEFEALDEPWEEGESWEDEEEEEA